MIGKAGVASPHLLSQSCFFISSMGVMQAKSGFQKNCQRTAKQVIVIKPKT